MTMDRKEPATATGIGRHLSMFAVWGLSFGHASSRRAGTALKSYKVYLFTDEVEMKDTYAEKGFDGVLLKPANLEAPRRLLP